MASYRLVFKKSVAKDLRGLPNRDVERILRCFRDLAEDPHRPGAEKISGQERYRIRRGDYRIIYEIEDEVLVIVVVKVGHRKDVYRSL
ncbi:MAG: type II toxin-antitoxin system RelE/ParE family toxin [Candidatus Eisenbacteria bacterium]